MTNEIKPALSCDLHDGKITIISLQAFTLNVGPNYFYTAADVDRALAAAQKDAERLRAELAAAQKAAAALTEIVRMPNAEHVADAHNAAVRLLKEKRDE